MAEPVQRSVDSDVVECWALWKAVLFVKDLGILKIHVEGDSLTVINAAKSMDEDRSHIGGIMEVTKAKLARFSSFICTHIRRNGNKVAHELAKLAISIGELRIWHGDIHSPLRSLVAAEASRR
ncbi:hypothetical protein U1Q18_008577 [Sarracenia purpurea var. burkii]